MKGINKWLTAHGRALLAGLLLGAAATDVLPPVVAQVLRVAAQLLGAPGIVS